MSARLPIAGRLTKDPELTFLNSGKPMVKFSVATSKRFKNDQGQWEDRDTSFWDCTAFGPLAENIAESTQKGTGVIVLGDMHQEFWEKDGEKKSAWRVNVEDLAVSCRWNQVKVTDGASSNGYSEKPPF